jgi:hypothetical protein
MKDFDQQIKAGDKKPSFDADRFPGMNIDQNAWPSNAEQASVVINN